MSFWNPTPEETEAAFAALLAGPIVAPPADEGASPADLPLLLRLANARVEVQIRQTTDEAGLDLTPAAVHVLRSAKSPPRCPSSWRRGWCSCARAG
jgi:hypothetical protein